MEPSASLRHSILRSPIERKPSCQERKTTGWLRTCAGLGTGSGGGRTSSERQWGTVREDYSADGDCWDYFPHDHARSRAYRWGEDGLLGISDRECRLCFALALWNGRDPILKERLFGLTGPEGNHGEDVKELYYYLDSTPTHSYLKALYKYPQAEFPYDAARRGEPAARTRASPSSSSPTPASSTTTATSTSSPSTPRPAPDDILIRITDRQPRAGAGDAPPAADALVPQHLDLGLRSARGARRSRRSARRGRRRVDGAEHATLGRVPARGGRRRPHGATPRLLFTENETNAAAAVRRRRTRRRASRTRSTTTSSTGEPDAVNPARHRHEGGGALRADGPGRRQQVVVRLRLRRGECDGRSPFGADFDEMFADAHRARPTSSTPRASPTALDDEQTAVARQAYAGLLWTQAVLPLRRRGLARGRPGAAGAARRAAGTGATATGQHLFNRDVISMPDKWEYPWYAAWDLAFHMIPFAQVDPRVRQGAARCCSCASGTCTRTGRSRRTSSRSATSTRRCTPGPCWRVYKMTGQRGQRDRLFLERAFQKLLINFTWWVNRKDVEGKHLFAGGFLGLDNIGVFDRSQPLPGRRPSRAGRRHRVDGVLLRARCSRWRSSWRARTRPTRTSPPSSSSTSSRSPTR